MLKDKPSVKNIIDIIKEAVKLKKNLLQNHYLVVINWNESDTLMSQYIEYVADRLLSNVWIR